MILSLVLPIVGALPQATPLKHVRVESTTPHQLATRFESRGFDVIEGGVSPTGVELVVTDQEWTVLESEGFAPILIAVGRPFYELASEDGSLAGYPDLDQVMDRMQLAEDAFPQICELVDLTDRYAMPPTFEGRHLYAVKVSDNVGVDEDEPSALIVSAHHCREIVTPLIALEAIRSLAEGYGVDPQITQLVDEYEIWIAPMWNPDGYVEVFEGDNFWRKNKRVFQDGVGVDLNRNYPFGWDSVCSGSEFVQVSTYKGPSAGSEAETQTMMAFSEDRHFDKVLDFHSYGSEVLWGYSCHLHPFDQFFEDEAIALSIESGYGGEERRPSAEGEHYEWQIATYGNYAFLMETHIQFQPSFESALAEVALVWPGILWFLERPLTISGHVEDACTEDVLGAAVELPGETFSNGETNTAGGPFGRYSIVLPPGAHQVRLGGDGIDPDEFTVQSTLSSEDVHDAVLTVQVSISTPGASIGQLLQLFLDAPADAGQRFVAAIGLAGTSPGIPIGGCVLPMNPDALALGSSSGSPGFAGFSGFLDGAGQGVASATVPANPALVGTEVDAVFLTLEAATSEPLHPSNAVHFVVGP